MLRPGNAGSNTAADHVEVISRALEAVGLGPRPGQRGLVRADGAGGTKETIELLTRRWVSYSVGFTLPDHTPRVYDTIPQTAWTPACNADGEPRQGADVDEITDLDADHLAAGEHLGHPAQLGQAQAAVDEVIGRQDAGRQHVAVDVDVDGPADHRPLCRSAKPSPGSTRELPAASMSSASGGSMSRTPPTAPRGGPRAQPAPRGSGRPGRSRRPSRSATARHSPRSWPVA